MWPRATMRSAIAAIWSAVLPSPRMTSGNPWRGGAVVIDPRETQILERLLAESSGQLIDSGVERDVAT